VPAEPTALKRKERKYIYLKIYIQGVPCGLFGIRKATGVRSNKPAYGTRRDNF
jgi:hypothetical protein